MKNVFATCVLIIILSLGISSCANIIPPGGGARDTIAPILIQALPKDSTTQFTGNKIVLNFNEFVEAKEIQQNVVVNPLPKNQPVIDYKLKTVSIKLKDTLEPNTTYTINFGNAVRDINESNIAKNLTYTFSTGKQLDNFDLNGKLNVAETGGIDSTLVIVLHKNLSDTAIAKVYPNYLTKVDGKGNFSFTHLPKGRFNVFAISNDYSKTYSDTTKLFAFTAKPISVSDSTPFVQLFAFNAVKAPQNINALPSANNTKKISYEPVFMNGKLNVLDSLLTLEFNKKINLKDSILLSDTNYLPLVSNASIKNKSLHIKYAFELGKKYKLIMPKNSIADSVGNGFAKNDTLSITAMGKEDFGKVKIRIAGWEKIKNPVLQLFANDALKQSFSITSKEVYIPYMLPGEYELRILIDENNNKLWDTGNYFLKQQPEKIIPITRKLNVRSNWDNEIEINL